MGSSLKRFRSMDSNLNYGGLRCGRRVAHPNRFKSTRLVGCDFDWNKPTRREGDPSTILPVKMKFEFLEERTRWRAKPLASRGTPYRHRRRVHCYDTRRHGRSGDQRAARRIWCEDCRVVQMQFKQTNGKLEWSALFVRRPFVIHWLIELCFYYQKENGEVRRV
jgi:hypothetical protein